MPDESCRTCGGELRKYTLCAECKKVLQYICKSCNFTTLETHPHCLYVESHQTLKERNQRARTAYYQINAMPVKKYNFDRLPKALLICGAMAILVVALSDVGNLVSIFNQLETQLINSDQSQKHVIAFSSLPAIGILNVGQKINQLSRSEPPKYDNCVGSANGVFLTIKCLATRGTSYISVVEIPDGLVSQFGSKVFSMNKFSVNPGTDSLTIYYDEKSYVAEIMKYWDSVSG